MEFKDNNFFNIINYWIDVELSSPPIVRTNNSTRKSDTKWHQKISFEYDDDIIWIEPLKNKIDDADDWVHRVYLGVFNTEIVIKEFSDDNDDVNELKSKHNTCLVSFLVDEKGYPIKDTIVIPEYLSYIAYAKADNKSTYRSFEDRIKDLYATWSFTVIKNRKHTGKEELNEFTKQVLLELNWGLLANTFLEDKFYSLAYTESLSIKKNRVLKFDSEITHSLIANDLKNIREKSLDGFSKSSLGSYMNFDFDNIERKDVLRDKNVLMDGLSPKKMANVTWPNKNNYKLVSSQQFAINTIFNDSFAKDDVGIFAVNGPPGTGKTTLLKDVIANIIFKRAEKLLNFETDPDKAFHKIGSIVYKFSDKGNKDVYALDESLTGYEIVVSSANNNAVQNITKELPLKKDVGEKWEDKLKYMSEIADNINEEESWGAISAVLGNKNNNYNFISKFLFSNTDDDGETTRSIFDFLKNPNYFRNEETLSWDVACKKFRLQKNKVEKIKDYLESLEYALSHIAENKKRTKELEILYKKYQKRLAIFKEKFKKINGLIESKKNLLSEKEFELSNLTGKDNSFFNKMMKKKPESDKKREIIELKKEMNNIIDEKAQLIKDKKIVFVEYREIKESYKKQYFLLKEIQKLNKEHGQEIDEEIPNNLFWGQPSDVIQKSSPWINNKLQEEMMNLFVASMDLHKSFITVNSKYIMNNLYSFKDILEGEFHEKDDYASAIWKTFFMVVPVVSTTFSSFGKLFENMKEGGIGWLLIDEAGQSTPQAPVGAMWRSKKAIVVGDPLQVEPVVTIEKKLSEVLLRKNNVDFYWNSYLYSAQQIADRNNIWGTNIKLGHKDIWVGAPLRVHRRCDDIMFSISNEIAYNNMMIQGKVSSGDRKYEHILGATRWIAIEGESDKNTHWIEKEGECVLNMLKSIIEENDSLPEMYIITPFKSIVFELNRYLKRNLNKWVVSDDITEQDVNSWLSKSVGTIHSFQGKETDAVILVLGGNLNKPGAITWVCEEPNILNVAVTRAKENFYIVGSSKIWNKGVFGLLKDLIEIDKEKLDK